jgi:hypothetical protein
MKLCMMDFSNKLDDEPMTMLKLGEECLKVTEHHINDINCLQVHRSLIDHLWETT